MWNLPRSRIEHCVTFLTFLTTGPQEVLRSFLLFCRILFLCFKFFLFPCCILWESWVSLVYVFMRFLLSMLVLKVSFPFSMLCLWCCITWCANSLFCFLCLFNQFCQCECIVLHVLSLPATCLLDQILYICERCTFLFYIFLCRQNHSYWGPSWNDFPIAQSHRTTACLPGSSALTTFAV